MADGTVAPLPQQLQPIAEGVTRLINSIFDPKALEDMVVEEKTTTADNKLNENFDKAEFQALWNEINHKYVYQVSYDSNELIAKAILHINAELEVKQLRYVMVEGTQDESQVTDFGDTRSVSRQLTDVCTSTVKYDLVGNYAPDWAIAMTRDGVKHIFFIAETKGTMSSMDLSAIEKAKVSCAEKLFNSISTANVKYHKVASYDDLLNKML